MKCFFMLRIMSTAHEGVIARSSDEAISFLRGEIAALPMVARNDSLLQLAVIVLSKNKRVGMAYP
jgi:hypothetical protein